MIVICPNCSKRYMLDDHLLPKDGRQVRCTSCQHVWRQTPYVQQAMSKPPLMEMTNVPFEAVLSSERKSGWLGWILLFIIILSISALLIGRDFVVTLWPRTERLYNLVGFQLSPQGKGLAIENATSQIHQNGSLEMVQVSGNIINTTDRVLSIPPLKVKLMGDSSHPKCVDKDVQECVLDHWEHRLSENSLLPGEQTHFETEPHPKVEGTQHISVEF